MDGDNDSIKAGSIKASSISASTNAAPVAATARTRPRWTAKRLLVASVGVATLHYTGGCKDQTNTLVANLMAAPANMTETFPVKADPTEADIDAGPGNSGQQG